MRRERLAGLATGLALAMLLAACATGGASPTPAVAVPATEGTGAALGLFTGRDECRDVPQTNPSAENDAEAVTCDRVATDPRLSGTLLSKGLPTGVGEDPKVYTAWAKLTLTNDGGTWSCDEVVMGTTDGGAGWRDQVCVGEGPYTGLTAYVHSISNDAASTFGILGWVDETP
jgi:hypothetical protein